MLVVYGVEGATLACPQDTIWNERVGGQPTEYQIPHPPKRAHEELHATLADAISVAALKTLTAVAEAEQQTAYAHCADSWSGCGLGDSTAQKVQ